MPHTSKKKNWPGHCQLRLTLLYLRFDLYRQGSWESLSQCFIFLSFFLRTACVIMVGWLSAPVATPISGCMGWITQKYQGGKGGRKWLSLVMTEWGASSDFTQAKALVSTISDAPSVHIVSYIGCCCHLIWILWTTRINVWLRSASANCMSQYFLVRRVPRRLPSGVSFGRWLRRVWARIPPLHALHLSQQFPVWGLDAWYMKKVKS